MLSFKDLDVDGASASPTCHDGQVLVADAGTRRRLLAACALVYLTPQLSVAEGMTVRMNYEPEVFLDRCQASEGERVIGRRVTRRLRP